MTRGGAKRPRALRRTAVAQRNAGGALRAFRRAGATPGGAAETARALRGAVPAAAAAGLAGLLVLAAVAGAEPSRAEADGPLAARVGAIDALPTERSVEKRLVEIRRRIQSAVVYPANARRAGLEGVTQVQFEIDRSDGLATDIGLARSSGHFALDRAAERSVRRAGALPWVYGRLVVPIHFELTP